MWFSASAVVPALQAARDVITGRVEVTDVRADKPVTTLAVSVSRDDGTVALSGTAVCYTVRLPVRALSTAS